MGRGLDIKFQKTLEWIHTHPENWSIKWIIKIIGQNDVGWCPPSLPPSQCSREISIQLLRLLSLMGRMELRMDGWWPPGMTERCPTVLVLITVKSHSSILLDRMLWAASLDWSPLHKLPSLGLNKNNLPLCCFLTLKLYFELFYCQLDWRFELWPYQIWVGYGVWLAVEQGPTTIIFNHNPTLKTSKMWKILLTYYLR